MEWPLLIQLLLLGGVIFLIVRKPRGREQIRTLQSEKEKWVEEKSRLESELQRVRAELGKVSQQVEQEKSCKDKVEGQLKQLEKENTDLKVKISVEEGMRPQLQEKVIGYEKERRGLEEKHARQINELAEARKSFEDERTRIRRVDEERQQQIKDERNRFWNEHQNMVGARLKEICQQPEIGFTMYDQTNLPPDFEGGLKPDYLVEVFAEQYVIFDAKFTENRVSTYFTTQVPATVQKIRKSSSRDSIYPTIFFVVPSELLQEEKKIYAFEGGFTFFMISPESLAPILACYKKMAAYQFVDQLDPQERENIVNVIAVYETFIRYQNAANVRLAKKAVDVTKMREDLIGIELNQQIDLKRKDVRPPKSKDSDVKQLANSRGEMERAIQDLISPKADLERAELEEAATTLS